MRTHGATNTRLYHVWKCMKSRCYNRKHESYPRYGGRGIAVCNEWKNSFEAFQKWAKSTGYSDEKSIDRIDNNGDYCPENCRWATPTEQARNRSSNHLIEVGGISLCVKEWAEAIGVCYRAITIAEERGTPPKLYIQSKLPNIDFG